jgi:hypothetical protein
MIFFYKPYYNSNYINPNKKDPSDICPRPKKLYKVYKLYNAKQCFLNIGKKLETKILNF